MTSADHASLTARFNDGAFSEWSYTTADGTTIELELTRLMR
jgi:hypothetical protein